MNYNFDERIIRTGTGSVKWDHSEELFGEKEMIPMWVADMDFRAPQPVIDALKEKVEHGIFGYSKGSQAYLEAVSSWMNERFDWRVETDWITHSPGVVPALNLIVQAFTKPGDGVIIQHPVYYPFTKVVEMNGRTLLSNPLKEEDGRYVMDFEDLEEKARKGAKLIILSSPHNPVGRVWSREELNRLGEICLKHGVLIAADEVHADLIMPGHRHIPLASLSEALSERTITCTAPSKTFNLAGLQTSNIIIANQELRVKFRKALEQNFMGSINTFGMVAAESAYRYGGDWLSQLISYIYENYTYAKDYISRHMEDLKVYPLEGTYLLWIDCRKHGLSAKELERLVHKEAKVAFNQGYGFGEGGEGFIRMNIACPRSTLIEGLERLKKAFSGKKESLS
ncbi:MalY/PatB family protein [Peribacillus kribbensis]|uniref:MalY/PatB family protein n=1 Tax=Peribacillus kribbensis TaxID=356658 RepID=UPI0004001924|nr:MalY/PatB family protein [Peribacillus kribbensis]